MVAKRGGGGARGRTTRGQCAFNDKKQVPLSIKSNLRDFPINPHSISPLSYLCTEMMGCRLLDHTFHFGFFFVWLPICVPRCACHVLVCFQLRTWLIGLQPSSRGMQEGGRQQAGGMVLKLSSGVMKPNCQFIYLRHGWYPVAQNTTPYNVKHPVRVRASVLGVKTLG